MRYSIVTTKGIEVIAKWVNNHFEIICYPDSMSVQVEWCYTLDYAAHRFQWLVAKYSQPEETRQAPTFIFKPKETQSEWWREEGDWGNRDFDLLDFS